MRRKQLVFGRWIFNSSLEGLLFFLPNRISRNEINGYSIYIPNEEDSQASVAAQELVPKEGDTIFLGTIEKIYITGTFTGKLDFLRLSHFREATSEDMNLLIHKMSTLRIADLDLE